MGTLMVANLYQLPYTYVHNMRTILNYTSGHVMGVHHLANDLLIVLSTKAIKVVRL
jgi:hypothetical protein